MKIKMDERKRKEIILGLVLGLALGAVMVLVYNRGIIAL